MPVMIRAFGDEEDESTGERGAILVGETGVGDVAPARDAALRADDCMASRERERMRNRERRSERAWRE